MRQINVECFDAFLGFLLNTTAYRLGQYDPSSPSTEELHGSVHIDAVGVKLHKPTPSILTVTKVIKMLEKYYQNIVSFEFSCVTQGKVNNIVAGKFSRFRDKIYQGTNRI